MIRVQYKDQLSPGLNGTAERSTRGTTVYLVPGLTYGQRRATLRRLRQEASRGCGPALPGADLTAALAADRCRTGFRRTAAVIRLHPVGSLLPTALAGLLMTLFVVASVSARLPSAAAPGGPADGAVTVIGYPALAKTPWAGPGLSGHQLGRLPAWSLTASSSGSGTAIGGGSSTSGKGTPAPKAATRRHRAARTVRAPWLPWPPPPGGWPHWWPAEHSVQ